MTEITIIPLGTDVWDKKKKVGVEVIGFSCDY